LREDERRHRSDEAPQQVAGHDEGERHPAPERVTRHEAGELAPRIQPREEDLLERHDEDRRDYQTEEERVFRPRRPEEGQEQRSRPGGEQEPAPEHLPDEGRGGLRRQPGQEAAEEGHRAGVGRLDDEPEEGDARRVGAVRLRPQDRRDGEDEERLQRVTGNTKREPARKLAPDPARVRLRRRLVIQRNACVVKAPHTSGRTSVQ
jgi:hypothetical protein